MEMKGKIIMNIFELLIQNCPNSDPNHIYQMAEIYILIYLCPSKQVIHTHHE